MKQSKGKVNKEEKADADEEFDLEGLLEQVKEIGVELDELSEEKEIEKEEEKEVEEEGVSKLKIEPYDKDLE